MIGSFKCNRDIFYSKRVQFLCLVTWLVGSVFDVNPRCMRFLLQMDPGLPVFAQKYNWYAVDSKIKTLKLKQNERKTMKEEPQLARNMTKEVNRWSEYKTKWTEAQMNSEGLGIDLLENDMLYGCGLTSQNLERVGNARRRPHSIS